MSNDDKKEEFLKTTDKVRRNGEEIKKYAHNLLIYGQNTMDLADASRRVTEFIDPPQASFWQDRTVAWNELAGEQEGLLRKLVPTMVYPITVSSVSASSCVLDLANADLADQWAVAGAGEDARNAAAQLSSVIDRFADKDTLISLIKSYGLDWASAGAKTPVELLETAIAAYEKPVSEQVSANTSLLPVRECCNSIITQLINRRPRCEKVSNQLAKIRSIGAQLRLDTIPSDFFEKLATRWKDLWNDLSESKKADYSRFEWKKYLQTAILFLLELLQSIDPNKMNPKKHIARTFLGGV